MIPEALSLRPANDPCQVGFVNEKASNLGLCFMSSQDSDKSSQYSGTKIVPIFQILS